MFNFVEVDEEPPVLQTADPNQEDSTLDHPANPAKFDITFTISQYRHHHLHFNIKYNTQLFKRTSIQEFIESFKLIASQVAENPAQALSHINMASPLELQNLWADSSADLENE